MLQADHSDVPTEEFFCTFQLLYARAEAQSSRRALLPHVLDSQNGFQTSVKYPAGLKAAEAEETRRYESELRLRDLKVIRL